MNVSPIITMLMVGFGKAKEKPDHEFPHIVEIDGKRLCCTRCGSTTDIAGWLEWMKVHAKCAKLDLCCVEVDSLYDALRADDHNNP